MRYVFCGSLAWCAARQQTWRLNNRISDQFMARMARVNHRTSCCILFQRRRRRSSIPPSALPHSPSPASKMEAGNGDLLQWDLSVRPSVRLHRLLCSCFVTVPPLSTAELQAGFWLSTDHLDSICRDYINGQIPTG